jgi:hypothetical protein
MIANSMNPSPFAKALDNMDKMLQSYHELSAMTSAAVVPTTSEEVFASSVVPKVRNANLLRI